MSVMSELLVQMVQMVQLAVVTMETPAPNETEPSRTQPVRDLPCPAYFLWQD